MVLRRWLQPGIGIKRWLVVAFLGEMLIALAAALDSAADPGPVAAGR